MRTTGQRAHAIVEVLRPYARALARRCPHQEEEAVVPEDCLPASSPESVSPIENLRFACAPKGGAHDLFPRDLDDQGRQDELINLGIAPLYPGTGRCRTDHADQALGVAGCSDSTQGNASHEGCRLGHERPACQSRGTDH